MLIWFILSKMAFGAKLYMLGSNATAAKFSGLNSVSLLVRTYALSGLCAGVAGLVMMANYNSAKADYGMTYTLLTVLIVAFFCRRLGLSPEDVVYPLIFLGQLALLVLVGVALSKAGQKYAPRLLALAAGKRGS